MGDLSALKFNNYGFGTQILKPPLSSKKEKEERKGTIYIF
jgi:hypothetical protein